MSLSFDGDGGSQRLAEPTPQAMFVFVPQQSDPYAAWTDFDRAQKKSAAKLAASKPATSLLVECISLKVALAFVRSVGKVSSLDFDCVLRKVRKETAVIAACCLLLMESSKRHLVRK